MGVTAPGADQLASSAARAAAELADLSDVDRRAADLLATAAVPLTPRLTGRLAASIRPGVDSTGAFVIAGGNGAPYAPVVNAHQPWLARTVAANDDRVTKLYQDAAEHAAATVRGT